MKKTKAGTTWDEDGCIAQRARLEFSPDGRYDPTKYSAMGMYRDKTAEDGFCFQVACEDAGYAENQWENNIQKISTDMMMVNKKGGGGVGK